MIGLAIALVVVLVTTPLAIKVAERLEFYDKPVGYKSHVAPTPYLGGTAVVVGFVIAVLLLGGRWDKTIPLLAGVLVLWAVGTIDDRRTIRPSVRVALEIAVAGGLWGLGLGWDLGAGPLVDLAVSALWIVAVVNAFNLFDNMDGAASSMAAVVAAGLALLGVVEGDTWLAVTSAALCGAAVGFLPHNLFASPARIFLGDGGSMPVGFAVAAVTMMEVKEAAPAWQSLAMGLLFVGIPALDTTLVIVSRRRRHLSVMTAGLDHLTHRARLRFQTARAVAVALGAAQALVSALAVLALRGGSAGIVVAVVAYVAGLGVAITVLDTRFAPDRAPAVAQRRIARRAIDWPALVLVVPLAIGLGISPFLFGYYHSEIWVPIALGLLGVATAGLIARPPPLSVAAGLLMAAVTGIGVWALTSALWADSIEQAVVEGNRWLAYAALALVLLVLVRTERTALVLLGVLGLTCLSVAGDVLVRMLGSDPASLFLSGRLDAPLGYINGLGSFFLVAMWPCMAAAEHRRPPIAAAGMVGATLLAGLLVLSQSRGIAVAVAVSVVVVLLVAPRRVRRGWALVVLGGAVAAALPALLDVYASADGGAVPAEVTHRAARQLIIAAVGAGLVWGGLTLAAARWPVRRAAAGVLLAGLAVGLVIAVVSAGRIADTVHTQYTAFVHLSVEPQGSAVASSRLVSGAGNRYDYWRIAWQVWNEHPVRGVGAGNYDGPYFARRTTTEDIRQPHSIELQLLSELGLVGALLLGVTVAALALGARRLARAARSGRDQRTLLVAALGMVVAWLVHTSVDWIHLLPGVTGMALVAAAVLVGLPARSAGQPGRVPRTRWPLAIGVALALTLAAVSLSRQGLAERFRSDARDALARDPAAALRAVDRSLRLDPEAVSSYYVKAAALARFNEARAARGALLEAARREPRDFVTWALLGDLAVRSGALGEARRMYRRALRLNPRDPSLRVLATHPERSQ